jgi:hypothetical protein
MKNKSARVTTADAEQSTVAAFRPWRGSKVRIPWALAKSAGKVKPKVCEGSKQILVFVMTKKKPHRYAVSGQFL